MWFKFRCFGGTVSLGLSANATDIKRMDFHAILPFQRLSGLARLHPPRVWQQLKSACAAPDRQPGVADPPEG